MLYTDVDHEVKEVTSGHRVVLAYNLRSDAALTPPPPAAAGTPLAKFAHALQLALANEAVLPSVPSSVNTLLVFYWGLL